MIDQTLESRLAMRGLPVRRDAAFRRMLPWTRIAFAVGGLQMLFATLRMDTDMMWTMVPVALLAVVMPHHLIEYAYNFVIRHITRTEPLPANKAPVRFAFFMASVTIACTATAFDAGFVWLGFVLGGFMVVVSATLCLTHFCLPAAIWSFLVGRAGCGSPALAR